MCSFNVRLFTRERLSTVHNMSGGRALSQSADDVQQQALQCADADHQCFDDLDDTPTDHSHGLQPAPGRVASQVSSSSTVLL